MLDGLVGPADHATEDTRRAAYLRCLEYANEAFPDALDYNPFVALAAGPWRAEQVRTKLKGISA